MTTVTNLRLLLDGLAFGPACLVSVESCQGSAPRESGAWMAVFADRLLGSVGGGQLELRAIAEARRCLLGAPGAAPARLRFALGPSLGQCCGGVVYLRFERCTAADAPLLAQRLTPKLHPVALFGGGHIGQALARVLTRLPLALTWIDSRDGVFAPGPPPEGLVCEHCDPVQMAVPALAAGSRVLIMSFSHAEDLDLVAACLRRQRERQDLPFVGLIGSKSKWATFSNRLLERGFARQELAHIHCPVGVAAIAGKQPEVIAIAVAAQLLQSLGAAGVGQQGEGLLT